MTKEQAIKELRICECYSVEPSVEALDLAIKALEQQPSGVIGIVSPCKEQTTLAEKLRQIEQSTSDDCVSREKVWYMITGGKYPNEDYEQFIDRLVKELENMPPVTPTRKVGKWIKSNIGGAKVCSICQAHMGLSNFNYCPTCGAEMRGAENELD